MNYFKYTEMVTTSSIRYGLDKGSFTNKIKEYLVGTDSSTGAGIYVASVDLNEEDLKAFARIQKVTLEPIEKADWDVYITNCDDYKIKRSVEEAARDNEISLSTVTYKNIILAADESSMARMNRIVTTYNYKFNNRLANGIIPSEAFKVYDETVQWKAKDKVYHTFTIREIFTILELAMSRYEQILRSYS